MQSFVLTYIITTYNKIEFLKITLERTIKNCAGDEEIVVVDGGSSDGTAEYLGMLYDKRLIHQYVSEKDYGEGHGYNKAILMARGQLIKIITDDDVFCFEAIRVCKNFMLNNPQIDLLNTHGANYNLPANGEISVFTTPYDIYMKEWIETGKPFDFCMLGTMLNKRSLALLGLLNPSIKRADAEYSLRVTSQKIKMAWYSAVSYVRVHNDKSNSQIYENAIREETDRLAAFYNVSIVGQTRHTPLIKKVKNLLINKLKQAYLLLIANKQKRYSPLADANITVQELTLMQAFKNAELWLNERHASSPKKFCTN